MRAVTVGVPIWSSPLAAVGDAVVGFLECAKAEMSAAGLSARTLRITLPAVPPRIATQPGAVASTLAAVQQLADRVGVRWFCLPIDLTVAGDPTALLAEVRELLLRNPRLFVNLIVADSSRISIPGARAAAEMVLAVSRRSHNGFDGFRVGVSCACQPNTPFFPFSRHVGDDLAVSLALETTLPALRALDALPGRSSVEAMRDAIGRALTERIRKVDALGHVLHGRTGFRYAGLDASYAPLPDGESSVASLIERFGVSPAGSNGTSFATSILTDTLQASLDEAGARLAGFNGVMYSVLEDRKLASANNLGSLSIDKLLLFSAFCGCGVDMVPIPATTYVEDVAAIILDVAALAVRLGKPLGVRVVPIPGKQINEYVQFNLDFLCDSRVMNPGLSDSAPFRDDSTIWEYRRARRNAPSAFGGSSMLDRDKIRRFWDERAKLYKDVAFESIANLEQDPDNLQLKISHETEKVFSWVGDVRGQSVLDLGAGVGQWAFRFAERGAAHVRAVEYSADLVAIGRVEAERRGAANVTFDVSPAESYVAEQTHELVFCSGLFVYLDDAQFGELIRRLPSWVAPGGTLLIRDGIGRHGRHEIVDRFSEHLQSRYSATYRTRDQIVEALQSSDLRLVNDEDMFPEGHPLNKYPETRLHLFLFRRGA